MILNNSFIVKFKLKLTFYIFLFFSNLCVNAENVVKQLSNSDGLSNNSVTCIFEDSQHLIWIGTWDGLNIFNGRDSKIFRYDKDKPRSISNNIIRQIVEQDSVSMWIATDYGINLYDRRSENFTRFYIGTERKRPKQEQSFLLASTADNTIVCSVREQGIFYYDKAEKTFKQINIPLFNSPVKDLQIDALDNMYLLLDDGHEYIFTLKHTNNSLSAVEKSNSHNNISELYLSQNLLFRVYQSNIKVTNIKTGKELTIDYDISRIISNIVAHNKDIYISFYTGGSVKYNTETKEASEIAGISKDIAIFSLLVGTQNVLWIGTDGHGLFQIYTHSSPFKTVTTQNPVRSFCQDVTDQMWIGTKGGGVFVLDSKSGTLQPYLTMNNGLISNSVYTMKKNNANDIFIGTEGTGINVFYAKTNKLEKLNIPLSYPSFKAVYSMSFTNGDSVLWLGTSGHGLIKIDLEFSNGAYHVQNLNKYSSADQKSGLNNDIIYAILPKNETQLWVGTRGGGVNEFNILNGTFERIDSEGSKRSLSNNDVLCLHRDKSQNLWVGTSFGLNRLSFEANAINFYEYTERTGLANNTIHGILEDADNNIWVSTNKGLSVINGKDKKISNYTFKDGLQNDEFSDGAFFKDNHQTLYFGGVAGFNYFNPKGIQLRNFSPRLTLNSLRIFNTSQNIFNRIKDNILELPYDERFVSFNFIAQDFINNENCEYAYQLSNFTEGWIYNGNNPNVVFTKLPPGKYILEVKCTNGDKVWSDNIYHLQIEVAYPWWQTPWALYAYAVLLCIIIYITQSVIRNRIRLNKELLLEHIEKDHQKQIHESKMNFFTNIAHEFFTPLTLIYGPAQHLLEDTKLDTYTKKYIQIIKNNADRMQKLINELMEFRKAETGYTPIHEENIEIRDLIDYVSDNYIEIAKQNKIRFNIETCSPFSLITDRSSLEKILFNLFSNAFKYTPNDGFIDVKVEQDSSLGLKLVIRNSGRGLTEQQQSEIFNQFKIFETSKQRNITSTGIGLNLTKSLVEVLGGTITVNSKYGEYVEFELIIPPMEEAKSTDITDASLPEITQTSIRLDHFNPEVSVLIIEDEKHIRELLKDILHPYYTVLQASDGEEALSMIEKSIPTIIISDVLMPHLGGLELIDKLKQNEHTAHIPIISISAKNTVQDHINAYEHGADLYITKPFHPRHILSTVENLINKQSSLKTYFNSSLSSMTLRDGVAIHEEDEQFLRDITQHIEKNIDDESLNPNSIAEFLGVSKITFYRRLKELTGKTPSEFVRNIRLQHAAKLLISTKLTVSEVMFRSGFANKSYFYREFAKQYELSPKEYRESK